VDVSLSHCEQSWEGDAFSLASPDIGLEQVQEMLRAAHGRKFHIHPRFLFSAAFPEV
jgi:hypothetical protein